MTSQRNSDNVALWKGTVPLSYQPPWGHTAHIPAAGRSGGGGSWRRGGERGAAIPVSVCDVCVCVFLHCQ